MNATLNIEDMTDDELLEVVKDFYATDSVRLGAACELISRLYKETA